MPQRIRVAILDDHQSIIDGYLYWLSSAPEIEVVATASYGEKLEAMLADHPIDVLLLDIGAPSAPDNLNPYPILHLLPKLLQTYPKLIVLVISVYNQHTLIRSVVEAGASGYIFKDDPLAIQKLSEIICVVANGGIFFSQQAHQLLLKRISRDEPQLTPRQLTALSLCAAYPNANLSDLAEKINVSNSTMRNLLSEAYLRLDVNNRTAAILKARKLGLITPSNSIREPQDDLR